MPVKGPERKCFGSHEQEASGAPAVPSHPEGTMQRGAHLPNNAFHKDPEDLVSSQALLETARRRGGPCPPMEQPELH